MRTINPNNAKTNYPFGMLINERSYTSDSYRFGFNGKEKDDEINGDGNTYDYGFRIYNPRLGKFLSVDPLFKSYPWYTPYQFAGNNPISFVDLDGKERDEPESDIDPVEEASGGSFFGKFVDKIVKAILKFTGGNIILEGDQNSVEGLKNMSDELEKHVIKWNTFVSSSNKLKLEVLTVADILVPAELVHQIVTGKNIDGSSPTEADILINLAGVLPIGKLAKGAKFFVKYGDEAIDVTEIIAKKVDGFCFTSDVLIWTKYGLKKIIFITTLDSIISWNEMEGLFQVKPVEQIFKRDVNELIRLSIDDEIVYCTTNHPFLLTNGKWIEASKISITDKVKTVKGFSSIRDKVIVDSICTVYNFLVADNHTYLIERSGIVVHNSCSFLKKKANDFQLLHGEDVIKKSEDYAEISKLSNEELIKSVTQPKNGDFIKVNTKTGKVTDGNTRLYEIKNRGLDVDVPYQNYTPDDSMFPDLK